MKRLVLAVFLLTASGAWVHAQETKEAAGAKSSEEPTDEMTIWKWANFLLLAAGLGYLIAKNLPSYFKSQNQEIQKGISEAQKMKRDAEARAAEMDRRMAALGSEIERFRVEAHGEMEQEGGRIRQETAKQIEKLQRQAEQEIESAGKLARRELKTYAARLALDLAEQRIRTRLDGATEAGLVDGFVQDLQQQRSQN